MSRPRAGGARAAVEEAPRQNAVRVMVADSSYAIRQSLADALSAARRVELVAICCDGSELEMGIATWRPDVVVTDVRMTGTSGQEGTGVAAWLREIDQAVGVVVLSQEAEPERALALLAGGARGRAYLLKERIRNRTELMRVIERVARGGCETDPVVVDMLIENRYRGAQARLSSLTSHEWGLLAALGTGKSNAEIADSLFLTAWSVEVRVDSIFAKLGIAQSPEAGERARTILLFLAGGGGDREP